MKIKKWLKWSAALLAVGFGGLQLTNPRHENPPVLPGHDLMASNPPPPAIASMLKISCYDCHSYETKWPWYGYVAPVSWYLVRDVTAARAAMNFSDWPHDDQARVRKRWRHIADDLDSQDMPLPQYTRMHPEARLTDAQRAEFIKWATEQAGD